jgi:hypothetical protein
MRRFREFVAGMPTPDETDGILRSKMPQISSKDYTAYMAHMKKAGITSKPVKAKPTKLKAIQKQFSLDGIVRSMSSSDDKKTKSILISKDGYVIDGNHRWLAARNSRQSSIDAIEFSANKDEVMKATLAFPKVKFKKHGQN